MPNHPAYQPDQEDQRLGRKEAFWPAFMAGFAFGALLLAALILWGPHA